MRKIFLTGLVFGMCAFLACLSRHVSSQTLDGKPDDKSSEAAIAALRSYHLKQALTTDTQIRESEEYLKTLKEDRRLQLNDSPERRKLDEEIEGREQGLKAMKERAGDAGRAKAEEEFKKVLKEYRATFERNNADSPKLKEDSTLYEKMWAEFLWHWVDRFEKVEQEQKTSTSRIEFKARVVDLDGNPIPKVKVIFESSALSSPLGLSVHTITKVGDDKGEFQLDLNGVESVTLKRIFAPEGYRYDPGQQNRLLFEAIKRTKEVRSDKRFRDDGFEKFVLVKDFQRTGKIVRTKCRIDKQGWSDADGVYEGPQKVAYLVDLFKLPLNSTEIMLLESSTVKPPSVWEKAHYNVMKLSSRANEMPNPREYQGKGDFVVQMFQSPADKGVGVLRITAIEGGVIPDSRRDYLAPETGYQPIFEYTFDISKRDSQNLQIPLYLKSRNNRACSRVEISLFISIGEKGFEDCDSAINISAIVSPTGERVFTDSGPTYTGEEFRELSKRDWTKKE